MCLEIIFNAYEVDNRFLAESSLQNSTFTRVCTVFIIYIFLACIVSKYMFTQTPPRAGFGIRLLLYFDLRPGPKCHSRWCTGRKWQILVAVMRGNRVGGNWLMKWDELKKSHDTLIDWRTGRGWPLNCMTVISARWRLNMRFQRSSGRWTII